MDEDCRILHLGAGYQAYVDPHFVEDKPLLHRLFTMSRPQVPMDYENITNYINSIFVLMLRGNITPAGNDKPAEQTSACPTTISQTESGLMHKPLRLKGQMIQLATGKHIMYLASPYVTTIQQLLTYDMRLTNIPLYDATRDLILLNQQRINEVEIKRQLDDSQDAMLKMTEELENEKRKAEALLCEVLPASVAAQLVLGEHVEPAYFNEVTVLFSEVSNFSQIVPMICPTEVVALLNDLFVRFDQLVATNEVYKVVTINDSYMIVSGAPVVRDDHSEACCHVALGMLWEAHAIQDPIVGTGLQVRIGMHTGPIVAGVVGQKTARYCLFGDPVTTASRMASQGARNMIHCTEATKHAAQRTGRFEWEDLGAKHIRGKGQKNTFYLKCSKKLSMWEIIGKTRDDERDSLTGFNQMTDKLAADEELLRRLSPQTKSSKLCSLM